MKKAISTIEIFLQKENLTKTSEIMICRPDKDGAKNCKNIEVEVLDKDGNDLNFSCLVLNGKIVPKSGCLTGFLNVKKNKMNIDIC